MYRWKYDLFCRSKIYSVNNPGRCNQVMYDALVATPPHSDLNRRVNSDHLIGDLDYFKMSLRLFLCCFFFSVMRPRAGRFWTRKVAKQTKENLYKKRLFMDLKKNRNCDCKGLVMLSINLVIISPLPAKPNSP
jgi:hypothetical protein